MALRNLCKQRLHRNLIRRKHSGMALCGRPVCLRDHTGCPDQRHPLSVFLKQDRLFRRIQIFSGSGMQNTCLVQDFTGIQQCIRSIIQRMVVRQRHRINPHLFEQGNFFRCQPERILLVRCLGAAAAERKFLVDCKIISRLDCAQIPLIQHS